VESVLADVRELAYTVSKKHIGTTKNLEKHQKKLKNNKFNILMGPHFVN